MNVLYDPSDSYYYGSLFVFSTASLTCVFSQIIYKEKEKEKAEKALENNKSARSALKEKIDELRRIIDQDQELNR